MKATLELHEESFIFPWVRRRRNEIPLTPTLSRLNDLGYCHPALKLGKTLAPSRRHPITCGRLRKAAGANARDKKGLIIRYREGKKRQLYCDRGWRRWVTILVKRLFMIQPHISFRNISLGLIAAR